MESLAVQPFAEVTVAVYMMVDVGVAVVVKEVGLLKKVEGVQAMVPVPVATKSTDSPRQMVVSLLRVTLGAETFTIT